jgi:DNA-binding response OmpR family regulator
MTGTKLAECLRSRYANLQVLYMSGYTDDAIVRNGGLEADASFLQKPFALNSLASMLRELLDRRIH